MVNTLRTECYLRRKLGPITLFFSPKVLAKMKVAYLKYIFVSIREGRKVIKHLGNVLSNYTIYTS